MEPPCGSPSAKKRAAYPELNGGPQQLVVLGSEVGGRWNAGAHQPVRDLVRRAKRRFVGMGQALMDHAGRVGATSRHEHSPRVSVAGAPPRGSTVGPTARTRARPCRGELLSRLPVAL